VTKLVDNSEIKSGFRDFKNEDRFCPWWWVMWHGACAV